MKGYIGVTDPNWYRFQKQLNNREVIFWRRSANPVTLYSGDYFFFLIRGHLPRVIKGYGIVDSVDRRRLEDMWNSFGNKNGCNTLFELESRIHKLKNEIIAYYYLKEVTYLNDRFITDEDVGFAKDIMAGKFIYSQDVHKLLNFFKGGNKPTFL